MLKEAHTYRRIIVPITLVISLLFAFVPAALAATYAQSPSLHLFGPKQHYLALGDSLAFGFQPNGDFTHGYVNDLFNDLQQNGTKDVKDLGCPVNQASPSSMAAVLSRLLALPPSSPPLWSF
jgi:hypothetical protein